MSQSQPESTFELEELFKRLTRSRFRNSFRLGQSEQRYLHDRRLPVVLDHARRFVQQRLGLAKPQNDGKQTPMRGHPVFVAQHATGTCCRSCLKKWHGIQKGARLEPDEVDYIVAVIERWLRQHDSYCDRRKDDTEETRTATNPQLLFDDSD